ncbi:MAG: TonB-dependent receptor [Sphingomonas sp.]
MKRRTSLCISVAANVLCIAAAPAWAQDAAAPATAPVADEAPASQAAETPSATEQDIVVTGSRVARQGFEAPTPTIILSSEDLNKRGATNVGDFLNELPTFRISQSNQVNPQSSSQAAQTFADLRGLGSIRTLVLVDGRRFVPSAATGQVDLNLIPSVLVGRVETVTGGASAAYGSDAISGVVNVILDNKLNGLKLDASTGISTYGDNWERRVAAAFGGDFADGRGHIVLGGEYTKSDGISSYLDRDWGRRSDELVTLGAGRAADQPSRFYASGVRRTDSPPGGVIIGVNADTNPANGVDVLRGIAFGPGGTPYSFNYGNDPGTGVSYNGVASSGSFPRPEQVLVLPVERDVFMAHVDYDVTDHIKVFVEGNYGRSGSNFNGPTPRDTRVNTITIQRDNAYLPASIKALMTANNIASFSLGRSNGDWDQSQPSNFNTTERFVAGASGDLGGSWKWDGYYEYGRNVYDSVIDNIRIEQNYKFATDAVINPANNQVVCRALLPGSSTYNPIAAAGCVPINLFGDGSVSAAGNDYVSGTQYYRVTTTQEAAAANIRGNLFNTWAGAVAIAVGGEYRQDKDVANSDSLAQRSLYNFSNPKPFSGSFDTKEGYVEALVPLAKNLPFAHTLELNGAVRYTDYSSSGAVTTWKAGAVWEPVEGLTLRGTRSRDIRAPNASELFQTTSSNGTVINDFSGSTRTVVITNTASPSLQPEKADTWTGGVVFQPHFVRGLNISVDYFNINIKGAISSYGAQTLIDNCYAETQRGAPGFFCGFLTTSGTGAATSIDAVSVQLLNIASLKASGVDFDASYHTSLGKGDLSFRFFGTYTAHLIADDGLGIAPTFNSAGVIQTKGSVIDRAGQVGGFFSGANNGATSAPHWQMNGSIGYSTKRFSVTMMARYVGGGRVDNSLVDPDDAAYNPASPISVTNDKVSGRLYLNPSVSWNIIDDGARKVQLYGIVNNLLDADVPFPATQISGLYDRVGRFFRVGVRVAY